MARTVLLVDDHGGFRRMARLLLHQAGYAVVGEAASAVAAVDAARVLRPDVVLLDVLLPDGDGTEVAHELAALAYPPDVVLISSRHSHELAPRLESAPARGFVPKDELTVGRLKEVLG